MYILQNLTTFRNIGSYFLMRKNQLHKIQLNREIEMLFKTLFGLKKVLKNYVAMSFLMRGYFVVLTDLLVS